MKQLIKTTTSQHHSSTPCIALSQVPTHCTMIWDLPVEIQALIVSFLSPYDVRRVLEAFDNGELDHLFHVVTDHDGTPEFFPTRLPRSTTMSYVQEHHNAIFNLIEIKEFDKVNFHLFYLKFRHTANFISVMDFTHKALGVTEIDDGGPNCSEDGIVRFIKAMTSENSHILFFDSDSVSANLDEIQKNNFRVSFHKVNDVALSQTVSGPVLRMNEINGLTLLFRQTNVLPETLDLSIEPRELLSTFAMNGPLEISNKVIAARVVSHMFVSRLENIVYESENLGIQLTTQKPEETPTLKSVSAPNLTNLVIAFFETNECAFEDINVPSLQKIHYMCSDEVNPASAEDAERLWLQLPLSSLNSITYSSFNSHILFTPKTSGQFSNLKFLSFEFDDKHCSLFNGGYGEFPNLAELEIQATGVLINTDLVPDLNAPSLRTFKYAWVPERTTYFTGEAKLLAVVKTYPKLTTLDINLVTIDIDCSDLLTLISDRIENLAVSGISPDFFFRPDIHFPKLQSLSLYCISNSTDATLSFDAPNLSTLNFRVIPWFEELYVSDFPSLTTLKVEKMELTLLHLTYLPTLKELRLGSVCQIQASLLDSLEKLYFLVPEGYTEAEVMYGLYDSLYRGVQVKTIQLTGEEGERDTIVLRQLLEWR